MKTPRPINKLPEAESSRECLDVNLKCLEVNLKCLDVNLNALSLSKANCASTESVKLVFWSYHETNSQRPWQRGQRRRPEGGREERETGRLGVYAEWIGSSWEEALNWDRSYVAEDQQERAGERAVVVSALDDGWGGGCIVSVAVVDACHGLVVRRSSVWCVEVGGGDTVLMC